MEVKIGKKAFFVNGPDAPGAKDFWVYVNAKQWEYETYRIFDVFLNKEHSYVDMGAWVGPTVLYGAQLAKHCYAIEPDAVALQNLIQNINLNPTLKNKITIFNGCIWDSSGKVKLGTMSEFGDSMSSVSFEQSEKIQTVMSLTLDEYMEENGINDCNFIKMDIEGGESSVLPNAKVYLKKNQPTLFLSLHQFMFKDREQYSRSVVEALSVYKNFYSVNGRRITLDHLTRVLTSPWTLNYSVVATDKIVGIPERLPLLFNTLAKIINKALTHG